MLTKAIRVHAVGGPEALVWEDHDHCQPGSGEVLVRNHAIGLNFLDTYYRSGRYPHPTPFMPGSEGAGVIEAVGPNVTQFASGDRVAYIDPLGAYGEKVIRPADRLVRLPDAIDFRLAAAMMLKGITAGYLVRRTYPVQQGDVILVHAAAGGVGQILCQWAAALGATVIGTVGSAAKRDIAREFGCAHVIVTGEQDFVTAVGELTGGKGVAVAYDGVGAETFEGSLRSVRTRGLVAAFGAASGPIPLLDVQSLAGLGSIYVTRPALNAYTRDAQELNEAASALFEMVSSGAIKIASPIVYALTDAAVAHGDLEGRRTIGSAILVP
jgi:NADPH2:quinone reductase